MFLFTVLVYFSYRSERAMGLLFRGGVSVLREGGWREREKHHPDWDLSMPPSGLRDRAPNNGASEAN